MAQDILDSLIKIAPLIQDMIPVDCTIGITDREKYIYYLPGQEINLGNLAGKPIPEGGGMYKAIKTEKIIDAVLPKEVYGVPFKSRSLPLREKSGNVVGGLALGLSLKSQGAVMDIAQVVASSTQQTSATIKGLASSAQQLADIQNILETLGKEVVEQVKKTDTILGFIHDVANTSNLLGLSAAIEAARAGENGKGFSVVADEIRKMSVKNTQAVKEIKEILATINNTALLMIEKVINTAAFSEEQAAATQEISAAMHELANSAEKLEEVARIK
ncbi:methyl-accepting chemotaxis protein [Pelotomaculum isophthalicicum JI]|uniref:Methyl-accepting chemotaxis protein n=1 Tax=Pelotomaculum isophthalicicum JI TaxID=947010 RepID=A0A9X4H184_9FIRM|nr:methyl-accepting chemotaxis protein [Pelotomaculum isophthalicicum]MDF9407926.1 methyl-accepting chemotaxis protein [Pelotomaculum isophthalicicum JI]